MMSSYTSLAVFGLALSFVLLCAAQDLNFPPNTEDMPQQPKISPDQFTYKRESPPLDFGGGQGLALPFPVLVVICLGFLGAAGYLVYKLLNMESEKERQRALKKAAKSQKKK